MVHSLRTSLGVLAIAALACGPVKGAAGVPFLDHEALYNLSLVKSRGSSPVDGAQGRILYDFSGNACEGYTSDFRQVSELDVGDGKVVLSDLRSTSWEDGKGNSFRFKIDTRTNDSAPHPVVGTAERSGDHITVKLTQPETRTFTIPGATVFPTQQIRRIIAAAKKGKSLLELQVYDGSDSGQKVYDTLAVIGQPIKGDTPAASPDPSTTNAQMKSLTRWPVTVSYYDSSANPDEGEQMPAYAMSFQLFENGVSRKLVLDYNDFVIAGALGKFEITSAKPSKPCQ